MVTSKLTWKQEEMLEKGKRSVLKPTHLITNTTNIDFGIKTWITFYSRDCSWIHFSDCPSNDCY